MAESNEIDSIEMQKDLPPDLHILLLRKRLAYKPVTVYLYPLFRNIVPHEKNKFHNVREVIYSEIEKTGTENDKNLLSCCICTFEEIISPDPFPFLLMRNEDGSEKHLGETELSSYLCIQGEEHHTLDPENDLHRFNLIVRHALSKIFVQ